MLFRSGLKATYDKDTDKLTVTWDAYKLAEADKRTTQFDVTVGAATRATTDTSIIIDSPPKGNVSITVRAKVGTATSPNATIQIAIEEPKKPEEEEESKELESSSSSESAQSSESSESVQESESSSVPPESQPSESVAPVTPPEESSSTPPAE